ncbi:MAG: hypothetical protein F9K13_06980 [Candidatus Methylomirabilis oxygeniifera]|uniref:Uncharacterized protein n=1 Tax=Methylomirabilis oxygeniifera TaxID=671143 RepID=D5MH62_METO1|nr:MAG: hypothetical protein F9K13_06980 [Candidatus Methylomirabilis oxyfera]CBE69094.1 conserved protein of unknown function [Candidatus Methylomirabilis oxyfera]
MEHTKLVTASELEDFADRRDSEPVIPELVAQLVNFSVPDLTLCRIPYGDAIGLPGLDGMVQTEGGFRQFVPKQTSYWEISRGADAQGRATENYTKRTDETPVAERADVTFVFVTPRSRGWDQPSQAAWIQKRQGDGWKEVKVIDGVQLCEWLREFPAMGKWLLQRIGLVKALAGFQTPAEHWSHLAQLGGKDDPPLPPKIFLAGRENACLQLERLFRHETQQLILSVESENDAEDFVAAFLESLDENTRRAFSSRCLFISDPDAWHTFSNLRCFHILVASPRLDLADSNEQLHLAARTRGHGIIFSVSGAWSHGAEKLVPIMSPSRSLIETTLIDSGFAQERAAELASAGAQSLAALKRFLRGLGELPPYATWENARLLAQASMVGKWKGDSAADREAMEILLGKAYGEWIEEVRAETLRADPPLIQRNEVWKVISRGEAWSALGPRMTDEDLDRFQKMALRILGEKDPQFDLPKDERYAASIHGKVLAHSRLIREGVVESLTLLGAKANALSSTSQGKAEGTARLVVRKLLHEADWLTWASLNNEMPLLAEAAPDEFLDAVEAAVEDPATSPFIDIFRQEGGGPLGGQNYITGTLWALETLAWHPDYLGRVTTLLGDLASIDPGGSWANRPRNSLVDIFLPWLAQTLADLPVRRSALESLLREHPEVAWNVLVSLLPSFHGATSGTRKPIWRSLIPPGWKETVTIAQYWAQVQLYAEMCTQIAARQLDKLAQLVDRLGDLPEPAHSQVLNHLSSSAVTSLPEADRVPLWEALKDIALKHRKYADAQWAMPAERVAKIEEVARWLAPASFELANRRLFTERDFDLYEEKGNYEQERQRLDHIRQDAIKAILGVKGVDGVIQFAQQVESPQKVGDALGAIEDSNIDAFLLPAFLEHGDRPIKQFLGNFVWRRFWTQKWPWVDQQLSQPWRKEQLLAFLLLVPSEKQTWRRAERILGGEAHSYWKQVQVSPWGMEPDDLLEAAEKLTSNGQPARAIDCLYLLADGKVPIPMPLASAALLGALSAEEQQKQIDQYHIVEVVKWLQENAPPDSDDLSKIEWYYLPLLNRLYGGEPKVLEHKLASSPTFFCEVLAVVFCSDKEDQETKREISEAQKRIAQNAYSLLHGWRILPGSLPDGSFDGDRFAKWLDEVKRRCKESGYFRIAMDQLGQALAYAPQDPGGLWIHKSIAAALDVRDVPEMRRGFTAGLFNKRGTHGFSHGKQERQIAVDYRVKAKALSDSGFHRVADAVRSLAEGYERDAERESQRDIFDDR